MSELRPAAALPHCTLPSDSSRTIPSLPPFVPGAVNPADWACSHIAGSRGPLPWVLQGQVMGAGALRVGLCWAAWPESELTRCQAFGLPPGHLTNQKNGHLKLSKCVI